MTSRERARRLIEELPDAIISEVVDFMEFLSFRTRKPPLPALLAEAPVDDEPTTSADLAAIAEGEAAIARGDLLSAEELKRKYGLA